MKRVIPLVLVVGGVGLALWFVVKAQRPPATLNQTSQATALEAQAPPAATPETPPAPPAQMPSVTDGGEPIVYQFADDAAMREFATLWQQRQKALLRLAVVRAYWDTEQSGAASLNTQLQTQYHLNPAGNYTLDADTRSLIERPAAAAPGAPPAEGEPATTPPSAGEGTVVHTFASDEEVQAFAQMWQQRQGSGIRLAVLKSFWDEETVSLNKLNETLTSTYHLDVTKNYQLDATRRVVIERAQEASSAVTPPVFSDPPPVQPASP